MKTWNWFKELFLSLIFQSLQHYIWPYWWHQRSLETESGAWVLQKPKQSYKYFLTKTHINHDLIHHKRNNSLRSNFFSFGDSHKKEWLSSFIWDLKVDKDPKVRFVSFKFTPSNDRVLCAYAPLEYSAREQLDKGGFFEGLQNCNCTMDKIDRNGENKTQRLYWCFSSYALSNLIVDNRLESLWKRENHTCYDRYFGMDPE